MGQAAHPQLLGTVQDDVPKGVWIHSRGRKQFAPYKHEPDPCQCYSHTGHREWQCRSLPQCQYCASYHLSDECRKWIPDSASFPPRCYNCGGSHNAQSCACPQKPTPFSSFQLVFSRTPFPITMPLLTTYTPAPSPAHNALENSLVPGSKPR